MSVTNVGKNLAMTRLLVNDPQQNPIRLKVSEENMKNTMQRIKIVAAPMTAAEQQSRLDTQAAMDKGFIESHIRPMFEKKTANEAALKAVAADTSLTSEEKAARTEELREKLKVYESWLDTFKNMPAYNTFLLASSISQK